MRVLGRYADVEKCHACYLSRQMEKITINTHTSHISTKLGHPIQHSVCRMLVDQAGRTVSGEEVSVSLGYALRTTDRLTPPIRASRQKQYQELQTVEHAA
jgi:hypothetical protein